MLRFPRPLTPRVREVAVVVGRKVKRGLDLLGSVAVAGVGASIAIACAVQTRQPDAVLLQMANAARKADVPTATGERDFLLMMLGVGVVVLIAGLHKCREWFRPAPIKSAAS